MTGLQIDMGSVRAAIRTQVPKILQDAGDRMGAVLTAQTKQRFDEGGDEDGKWAPLWADNAAAVASVTKGSRADKKRSAVARNTRNAANRKIRRLDEQRESGEISRSEHRRRRRQATSKAQRANEIARAGTTDAKRAGGEPLRDSGALQASIANLASVEGTTLSVAVGSPIPHAAYHHDGFSTTGKNYIPLTARAHKGWNERLIPGYDYVVLQGVTVPARPIVRLTQRNIMELRETWAGG